MPNCLFALILTDGLQLPSGFVAPSAKTLILYTLVPAHWTDGAFGAADDGEWSDAVTLRRRGLTLWKARTRNCAHFDTQACGPGWSYPRLNQS